jgi:hypothetical protein
MSKKHYDFYHFNFEFHFLALYIASKKKGCRGTKCRFHVSKCPLPDFVKLINSPSTKVVKITKIFTLLKQTTITLFERRGGGTRKASRKWQALNIRWVALSVRCHHLWGQKFNILVKVTLLEVALKLCLWFFFAMNSFIYVQKKNSKKLCNLWKIKFEITTTGKKK